LLIQERQEIVKDLVALGQDRGYVSLDQVLEHAPSDLEDQDLSAIVQDLEKEGIDVDDGDTKRTAMSRAAQPTPPEPIPHEEDQGQDLVRTYLRQMSRVPLLTREGEVAIAKRIERGEIRITRAMSRSMLVARHVPTIAQEVLDGPRARRRYRPVSKYPPSDVDLAFVVPDDVAAAQGVDALVLATGSRSDDWAQRNWPQYEPVQFVEVGDFTGIALRRAAGAGVRHIHFVGMAGKITKLAAGVMMTHFHRSKVDTDLLAEVAAEVGAPPAVIDSATATNTARHFFEVCAAHGAMSPLEALCRRAAANCAAHTDGALSMEVVMVDFDAERETCRGSA